ncbi:MAG: hypothetical protein R3F19_19100 [Verrucomicrobiales bacterium]
MSQSAPVIPSTAEDVLAEREKLNNTVFAMEQQAQNHERRLVRVWDALLAVDRTGEGDKFDGAGAADSSQIVRPARHR